MSRFVSSPSSVRGLPFFSSLTEAQLKAVLPWVQAHSYGRRTAVLRSGEVADGLYVIASGQINVLLEDLNGHKVIVETLGARELFGEIGFVQFHLDEETLEAHGACEVLYIPRKIVAQALEANPAAALFVVGVLAERLTNAHRKIGSLALDDVYVRVLNVLYENGRAENAEWLVEVGSEAISTMVGASREMVSRVLKDLVARGAVRRHKRKIIVTDRERLLDCASQRRGGTHRSESAARHVRNDRLSGIRPGPEVVY